MLCRWVGVVGWRVEGGGVYWVRAGGVPGVMIAGREAREPRGLGLSAYNCFFVEAISGQSESDIVTLLDVGYASLCMPIYTGDCLLCGLSRCGYRHNM